MTSTFYYDITSGRMKRGFFLNQSVIEAKALDDFMLAGCNSTGVIQKASRFAEYRKDMEEDIEDSEEDEE